MHRKPLAKDSIERGIKSSKNRLIRETMLLALMLSRLAHRWLTWSRRLKHMLLDVKEVKAEEREINCRERMAKE